MFNKNSNFDGQGFKVTIKSSCFTNKTEFYKINYNSEIIWEHIKSLTYEREEQYPWPNVYKNMFQWRIQFELFNSTNFELIVYFNDKTECENFVNYFLVEKVMSKIKQSQQLDIE